MKKLLALAAALSLTPSEAAVDARDTVDRSAEIRAMTYDTKRDCTATLEVRYGTGARNLQGRGRVGMLGYDHIHLGRLSLKNDPEGYVPLLLKADQETKHPVYKKTECSLGIGSSFDALNGMDITFTPSAANPISEQIPVQTLETDNKPCTALHLPDGTQVNMEAETSEGPVRRTVWVRTTVRKLLIRQSGKGAVIDITGAVPDDMVEIPLFTPLKDVKSLDVQMRYHQSP